MLDATVTSVGTLAARATLLVAAAAGSAPARNTASCVSVSEAEMAPECVLTYTKFEKPAAAAAGAKKNDKDIDLLYSTRTLCRRK